MYRTIVADPPWPYATPGKGPLAAATKTNPEKWRRPLSGPGSRARYGAMSLEEISGLNVRGVVEDDAHLYLWTTNAFVVQAHAVARAWGFRPITLITWTKTMKEDATKPSMGTGFYFRGATEHVVFGVRGSLKLQTSRGISTAFLHPRTPHSVKPDAFFALVEECSPGPYLEMFARRVRPGWALFGNQAPGAVSLTQAPCQDARNAGASSTGATAVTWTAPPER